MAPVILVMDPAGATGATASELVARYGTAYGIVVTDTVAGARRELEQLTADQVDVAVVLADRAAGGSDVLGEAQRLHPHARRALLLGWRESRTHREEVADAYRRRRAEGFVSKPVGGHDERFHRGIVELLDEWWRLHGVPDPEVRISGRRSSPRVSEMCDALQRHDIAYVLEVTEDEVPTVELRDGRRLVDPTNLEVADALGARTRPGAGVYDVVIVGGGPAGLSAAVYAGSEGLRTALVEPSAMGGQAGTSSMIRNYLGFPRGISGAELATRAFEQAILFGTEMVYGTPATALRSEGPLRVVRLGNGTEVPGRAVVIATGVSYRTLDIASLGPFLGLGVHYGAAMSEAPMTGGEEVFVVGGGNSAGQAALHLARFARHVTILVRGASLAESMSEYLIKEIGETPEISIRFHSEVVGGGGTGRLEHIEIEDRRTGATTVHPAGGLFILIGAAPFTQWLPPGIARDDWGYVETGLGAAELETTMPGVFAVGDVRRGSIKRVASAAGEGAACIRQVHHHLETQASSTAG